MNINRNTQCGFTLIEVLVALAILAIASAAVIKQTALSTQHLARLEQKSIASFIAENQLVAVLAEDSWPPLGRISQDVRFTEQDWRVTTAVSGTSDPGLRRVEVSVGFVSQDAAVVSFTGFKGRH